MAQSLEITTGRIGVTTYGENLDAMKMVQALYTKFINDNEKRLTTASLSNPPFTTRAGGDPTKQTFAIFVPPDKEGMVLKNLHEVGAACLMWSSLTEETPTVFLIDEPDVAERAFKTAGLELTESDFITVVFTNYGLPKPETSDDPTASLWVRGVGDTLAFMFGFQGLLIDNHWTNTAAEALKSQAQSQGQSQNKDPDLELFSLLPGLTPEERKIVVGRSERDNVQAYASRYLNVAENAE